MKKLTGFQWVSMFIILLSVSNWVIVRVQMFGKTLDEVIPHFEYFEVASGIGFALLEVVIIGRMAYGLTQYWAHRDDTRLKFMGTLLLVSLITVVGSILILAPPALYANAHGENIILMLGPWSIGLLFFAVAPIVASIIGDWTSQAIIAITAPPEPTKVVTINKGDQISIAIKKFGLDPLAIEAHTGISHGEVEAHIKEQMRLYAVN